EFKFMLDYFFKNKNYLIIFFTIGYLVAFALEAFGRGNWEFVYYIVMMTVLIYIIVSINKRLHLAFFIIWNLSFLGFLHLLGGNFYLHGIRLYDYYFIPDILRYDNIVHTYGTFIATVALYSLLSPYISKNLKKHYPIFAIVLVLMAIGIGVLNELVEFFAVVFLNAAEQVGGYYNNALDLLFNTIGSILGTIFIYFYHERPKYLVDLKKELNVKIKKNR
ncbi:MAG: DUF2238 domain-containing protein, partial [Candidatus Buchananbacteria bacterium]|nr:DUF2238 domain-containing protein [Candidatus Buchananbacteria bacterium]